MNDWKVLPHGELVQLAPNLWQVTGQLDNPPLPRNMAVVRLPDGRLVLHSVVALDEARMKQLDALGPVAAIIVPAPGHRIDAARYKARYPDAKVLAPAAVRKAAEQVVPVDSTCEEYVPNLRGLHARPIPGLPELEYDVDLDGGGSGVIVCDALGHGEHGTGFTGWIMGVLGTPEGKLGLPRIVKWRQCKDYPGFRGWLKDLAARDDVRVLSIAHGDAIREGVRTELEAAAARA